MHITYIKHSRNATKHHKTGKATVKKMATDSTILLLPNHNTDLIPIRSAPMKPNNNLSRPRTPQHYSTNPTKPSSKRS
eukprot:CCRYP_020491-RA/>CCRYP_020491-RA protein AED:0.44 eAED:0.86 QI:0/0/0/1/1/1/2/0/77